MKLRSYKYRRPPAASTMGEMNMTPLIDVLLVLIVMLILTVPVLQHNLEVPLPQPVPGPYEVQANNSVMIDAQDRLFWNGEPLTRAQLGAQLVSAAELPEAAEVRFEPDANASYDRSAKTIALIKDSGIEKFGFVGNHRYAEFSRAD